MKTENKPETKPHQFTHDGDKVLILRRTGKDRVSKNGFVYPDKAGEKVEAPDWDPAQKCGGGLHGWPWALGLGDGADYELDDLWYVIAADPDDIVGELEGGWKCKIRCGEVKHVGSFADAMAMLRDGFHACVREMAVNGFPDIDTKSGSVDGRENYSKLAASGYYSKLAASGYYSKLAASGYYSKLAASGDGSKLAASGYYSKLAASGDYSKLAASGYGSKLAASGDYSKLDLIGENSVAAIAANRGRVRVGDRGAFAIAYYDENTGWDFITGKVGVNGVKANAWYRVESGKLVEEKE